MPARHFLKLLPLLLLALFVVSGCGSGDKNLWDAEDEVFFFHDLQDGDTDVPINAVFGLKPSSDVTSMKLYDDSGHEVDSEIHQDRDGHWYLSPDKFLDTYSWYTLEILFEDKRDIVIDFETGGSLEVTAASASTKARNERPNLLIQLPKK